MEFLIGQANSTLLAFVLSVVRIFVILTFIPLFEFKQIQARTIKVAISAAIGMPIFIDIHEQIADRDFDAITTPFIILKEVALGVLIGYILAMPFWIFQSVGAMIDNQRGALSAGYLNPASGPDASMIGDWLGKIVVIIMLSTGAFHHMFTFIYTSHSLFPVLEPFPLFQDQAWLEIASTFNYLVRQFVFYAGPVVLVLLLVEAAFAILGAYSPQLQVYFMAMPAKSLLALVTVFLYIGYLVEHIANESAFYFDLNSRFTSIFTIL